MGRAMFTIIGAMAELESSLISERVTAGMKAAAARGKHLGRPATSRRDHQTRPGHPAIRLVTIFFTLPNLPNHGESLSILNDCR
jgi:DNA invertase Pin-like site-specific DNA recombinase